MDSLQMPEFMKDNQKGSAGILIILGFIVLAIGPFLFMRMNSHSSSGKLIQDPDEQPSKLKSYLKTGKNI